MGCCCFCPSFFSSSKAPHSHVYISPLLKSQVSDEAQPPATQPEIHQVAISSSISQTQQKIQIGDGVTDMSNGKQVHFALEVTFIKDEANEDARRDLKSFEADSKQSSGEGESYDESLFSLQLVDGWSTANEDEVMSKEIHNNNEDAGDQGFTFPTAIQLKDQNEKLDKTKSMSGVPNEDKRSESEEDSVVSSLSSWLVDYEPENIVTNTPIMSNNVSKNSITQKTNGIPEKRRVLGELSLIEVNENAGQSLKSSGITGSYLNCKADSDSYGLSIQNIKQEMRRSRREKSRWHKEDQKIDLQKAIPLGLSLARAAVFAHI